MKHRIFALLCVLALLLAGCVQPPAQRAETTAPTHTTAWESAGLPTAPTEAPAEAPTEPPTEAPTEPPAEPAFFSGSPTAGGVRVHTDDSAYRPYAGNEAQYTRLREKPIPELEPSGDYGAIYPFVAARLFSAENDGGWQTGASYGFVDASGRIVTDGSYTSIRSLLAQKSDYGPEGYSPAPRSFPPLWIMTRVEDVELVKEGDYSWTYGKTIRGVAAMDGSFALPCVYSDVQGLEESFVCRRSWNGKEFEVYDLSGQLLFSGDDIQFGDPEGYWNVEYGEGLYLLGCSSQDNSHRCWYCDETGTPVLGPYVYGECFREGLACVSVDGGSYHFIDKTGAQALPGSFDEADSFYNERAVVATEAEGYALIDKTGKQLQCFGQNVWIESVPCGYRVNKYSGASAFYDRDGRLLLEPDTYVDCIDADTFCETRGDSTRIFRLSGQEQTMPREGYFYRSAALLDGEPVRGYEYYDYENNTTYFAPPDLSDCLELHPVSTPYGYEATAYTTRDECTGEQWYLMWDGSAWVGLSETGEQLRIPVRGELPKLMGDRVMVLTDRACVYLDREGNLLFSYPLENGD